VSAHGHPRRYDHPITVNLSTELKTGLERLAQSRELAISQLVRTLLRREIDRDREEPRRATK
jgi:hypothetical protein